MLDDAIETPLKMFEWCIKNISGIVFFYVSSNDVLENIEMFRLHERYDSWETVSGCRSHHSFIPQSNNEITMRRVSFDTMSTTFKAKNVISFKDVSEYNPGSYVACLYDCDWYVGNIIDISTEKQDIRVKFLQKPITNTFTRPK